MFFIYNVELYSVMSSNLRRENDKFQIFFL